MKKIMNKPENFVDEMLESILAAHPESLKGVEGDTRCIINARPPINGRVSIVTGGGSGHLPVFLGYVGNGMLDGAAVGNVFASPSADTMLNVTRAVDHGSGVLYIYGNYSGDIMNFDMAAEMAEFEDIKVAQLLVTDDVASAPKGEEDKRRGVAGLFYVYKIAGAKADEMASLDEVRDIAAKALANTRSFGVALSPCIVPEAGKPTFTLGDDEMEIGMGIHGEKGITRGKLATADEITDILLEKILEDIGTVSSGEVSILVNDLGATPLEELYIVFRRINQIIKSKGIQCVKTYIGEFATSMEMAGMSITVIKLDDELKRLLLKPCNTPFFEQNDLNCLI